MKRVFKKYKAKFHRLKYISLSEIQFLLQLLPICLIVIVGTFPSNDWSYTNGIDSPLTWVFNYLFEQNLSMGKTIIFPHGPLAFFMYPLPENVLLVYSVICALKSLLVINVGLLIARHRKQMLFILLISYLLATIANLNHLIIINIILLYCNYYINEKSVFKVIAFILTAFALFVKSYVAIISCLLSFSFVLFYLLKNKGVKSLLIDIFILAGTFLLIWLLMYQSFTGIFRYFWGIINLGQDNSSAAAYYNYNNWWLLSIFFLSIITIGFLNKSSKPAKFYFALTALSMFAGWKHGMARADINHVHGFFVLSAYLLIILVLFINKNRFITLIIGIAGLFMFQINMQNCFNYHGVKYELFRGNYFVNFIKNYDQLKDESKQKTFSQINSSKLPQSIVDSIKNSSVDSYPWDYSLIGANKFNWQPRPIIQSYAAYTSWLDKQNSSHFSSNNAPDFLVVEQFRGENLNDGTYSSIDSRYLLNDEPNTIISILKNYDIHSNHKNYLVFKHRENPVNISSQIYAKLQTRWGVWINVPDLKSDISRIKLEFPKSFLQRLKSFFYKDEQFWIYLMLDNNRVHKYRIVPKNAADGIWINPYLVSAFKTFSVKKVMFKASNQAILKDKLSLQWEGLNYEDDSSTIPLLLGEFQKEQILLDTTIGIGKVIGSKDFSQYTEVVKPYSFSKSFKICLDSLTTGKIRVNASCWLKSPLYKYREQAMLVISIDNKDGTSVWRGLPINKQLLDKKLWNHISDFQHFNFTTNNCTLNAYLWNNTNSSILMKDFRLTISK